MCQVHTALCARWDKAVVDHPSPLEVLQVWFQARWQIAATTSQQWNVRI